MEYFRYIDGLMFLNVIEHVQLEQAYPLQGLNTGAHRDTQKLFRLEPRDLQAVSQAHVKGVGPAGGTVADVLRGWREEDMMRVLAFQVAPPSVAVLASCGKWSRLPWLPHWRSGNVLFRGIHRFPPQRCKVHNLLIPIKAAMCDDDTLSASRLEAIAQCLQRWSPAIQEKMGDDEEHLISGCISWCVDAARHVSQEDLTGPKQGISSGQRTLGRPTTGSLGRYHWQYKASVLLNTMLLCELQPKLDDKLLTRAEIWMISPTRATPKALSSSGLDDKLALLGRGILTP